jgi:hypothetical protein
MATQGQELHMGSEIHHVDDNDFSRDMGASLGFSPSPDRPLRKGKIFK